MCSMSLTVVVSARSNGETMRPAISSGGNPVKFQIAAITGILISGKISTGVREAASGPMMRSRSARTTNVYGRRNAMRTMAVIRGELPPWQTWPVL